MAAITLGDMKTRLLSEVNKDATGTQEGVTFAVHAQNSILAALVYYQGEEFTFLEGNATPTLSSGESSEELPTDYHTPVNLRIQVNNEWRGEKQNFKQTTIKDIKDRRTTSSTGTPERWADWNGNIEFDVVADANYTLDFDYFKADATLPAADTVSSVFFDEGRDLILERSKAYFYENVLHDSDMAAPHKQNAVMWENKFTVSRNKKKKGGRLK